MQMPQQQQSSEMGLPAVLKDPFKEFVKIQPQNIMYDRRVVRGNTFAALVIPVSKLDLSNLWIYALFCLDMQQSDHRAIS